VLHPSICPRTARSEFDGWFHGIRVQAARLSDFSGIWQSLRQRACAVALRRLANPRRALREVKKVLHRQDEPHHIYRANPTRNTREFARQRLRSSSNLFAFEPGTSNPQRMSTIRKYPETLATSTLVLPPIGGL
jgi:hypothetical protein